MIPMGVEGLATARRRGTGAGMWCSPATPTRTASDRGLNWHRRLFEQLDRVHRLQLANLEQISKGSSSSPIGPGPVTERADALHCAADRPFAQRGCP
jgi:hypothetical protein